MKNWEFQIGEYRRLTLTNRGQYQLEEVLGGISPLEAVGIGEVIGVDNQAELNAMLMVKFMRVNFLAKVVWAALQHEKNPPTLDEVIDMMPQGQRLTELAGVCSEMVTSSYMGEMPEGEEGEPLEIEGGGGMSAKE